MKKLVLFFAVCMISCGAFASTYIEHQRHNKNEEIKVRSDKCGPGLRVATFATNPPFGWTEVSIDDFDHTVSLTAHGYAVDLMKKIGEEMDIDIIPMAYKSDEETWAALQEGNVDILMGQYYNPKVKELHHTYLAPAFFPNVLAVVFMKGKEQDVQKFEDLNGLKGIIRIDEGLYTYIRRLLPESLNLVEVPDSRDAFSRLLTGEADYLLASPYSAEAEARRFKMHHDIKMIQTPLLGQELFALFSSYAPCQNVKGEIAKKLAEKRSDIDQTKRDLISYIDKWGLRFIEAPALKDQLEKEKDSETEQKNNQ